MLVPCLLFFLSVFGVACNWANNGASFGFGGEPQGKHAGGVNFLVVCCRAAPFVELAKHATGFLVVFDIRDMGPDLILTVGMSLSCLLSYLHFRWAPNTKKTDSAKVHRGRFRPSRRSCWRSSGKQSPARPGPSGASEPKMFSLFVLGPSGKNSLERTFFLFSSFLCKKWGVWIGLGLRGCLFFSSSTRTRGSNPQTINPSPIGLFVSIRGELPLCFVLGGSHPPFQR